MKILFVVPRFHTNLTAAFMGMLAAGIKASVVSSRTELIEDHTLIEPIVVPKAKASWSLLTALLNDISPDVIVLRNAGRLSWRIHLLARLKGIPVIGYQLRPVSRPRSVGRLALETLWSGLPIWRFSPVKGLKRDGNRQDPYVRYLPLPVHNSAPGVRHNTGPEGPLRVLCVAKIAQPRKRHSLLLDALDKLDGRVDFRLTLIGADTHQVSGFSNDYLEKLTDRLLNGPLKSRITLLTNISPDQMAEHYLSHHVCVLPADREPLGISPLEAMAYGTVPLVSTATGSAGTVELAGDGMIFQAGDVDDLHARLAAFASDRQKLQTLGQQVREFAGDHLAPERFVEDLMQLIDDPKKR